MSDAFKKKQYFSGGEPTQADALKKIAALEERVKRLEVILESAGSLKSDQSAS